MTQGNPGDSGPEDVTRAGVRVPAFLDMCFECGDICEGQIIDLSISGALIAESDFLPKVGQPIRVLVGFSNEDLPVELSGTVVRHSEDHCFAVEFTALVQGADAHLAEALAQAMIRRVRGPASVVERTGLGPEPRGLRGWLRRVLLRTADRLG